MKRVNRTFPLPYFTINKNFIIQAYSEEAEKTFGSTENLLDIVDEESLPKIRKWVVPDVRKLTLEIHLKPFESEGNPLTCDLHVNWQNDLYAEVLIIMKDAQLLKVTKTMDQLRSRLDDTNFALLEEKEKLEEAIQHGNRLSAPFINLTCDTALVPLFGQITVEKMYAVEEELLQSSQDDEIDRILFDFTAVGEMDPEGTRVLKDIMSSLFYMGVSVVVVGLQPKQVKNFHVLQFPSQISFLNSLQQAIQKYCTT
ncbi:rsbT co-antagonist protein RsbR [Halobacillus dabanensis]|uniref:RsbT co-antagonist protein RsbR n=1 Tax=Halobacillus dabanensis TaxID=240302 RepID=A0A1I3R9M5_HALDA|nr:STAS domain-containing protein [Halobacillus dabanensis]SFJ42071.1 rsbT co-antagonist protein RsbR [Halobacillus dabanensis]